MRAVHASSGLVATENVSSLVEIGYRARPVERLDGWKCIAAYLKRDRTTVIRWARERGLPVHRLPGGRTGTVYALKHELDAWLGMPDAMVEQIEAVVPVVESVAAPEAPGQPVHRPVLRWIAGLAATALAIGVPAAVANQQDAGAAQSASAAPASCPASSLSGLTLLK